jgi:hypothetical protein
MQVSLLEHFTEVNHKPFALAPLHYLNNNQMLHLLQQMLQHAESTLTVSHLLFTLMRLQITKITCTALDEQHALAKPVQS